MDIKNKRRVAGVSLASLIIAGISVPAQAETPPGYNETMLQLINEHRANNGLDPVEEWDGLSSAAYAHSNGVWAETIGEEMTSERLAELHASGDEQVADAAAVGCVPALAENMHFATYVDPEAAMSAYIASPSHNAVILDPSFSYVGLGTFVGEDGRLFNTQRFAADCTDSDAIFESEFSNVSVERSAAGALVIAGYLEDGSSSNPVIDVASPDGSMSTVTGVGVEEGLWHFTFTDESPNVSGVYEFTFAGVANESTSASWSYNHDASTSISGYPASFEAPRGTGDVDLGTVTIRPGYGRTVHLQEQVDGEWTNLFSATIDGASGEMELSIPASAEEVSRTFRIHAPETDVAMEETSAEFTVDFVTPDTIVTGLPTSIEAQWGDARATIEFSVNSEGPRTAILSRGEEVIDTVEDFTGSASFLLPSYEVGQTEYTLTIPANMYGTEYTNTISVNVSKRTTQITEFEGENEVYVGEEVPESELLFFVNRSPGTEGTIEVLEDGNWVEAGTFTVGQDHFTRATLPAQDVAGTYTYRVTVPESDTHTSAVSGERTVTYNLYEREASTDAVDHTVFLGDEGATVTVEAQGEGTVELQLNNDGTWDTVDSAALADGSAELSIPTLVEEGDYQFRVHIAANDTHEEWTSETFTVEGVKQESSIEGWESGALVIGENEELSYTVTVSPATEGREVELQSSANDEDWEPVQTFTTDAEGNATVVIPAAEVDTTTNYRVVAVEAPYYYEAASEVLTVTVQEFPTNVNGVPTQDITQRYGDDPYTFNIGIDNANGRAVLLQRDNDGEWETISEYTAPDAPEGLVTITMPAPEQVGTANYRVFLPEVQRGGEWTSAPFALVVERAETSLNPVEHRQFEIGDEGSVEHIVVSLAEGGEGLDRTATLERLDGEEWVAVGEPVAQGEDDVNGGEADFVFTVPVDELGVTSYRVVVAETGTHEAHIGDIFQVEVHKINDNIEGESPGDVTVEVTADEELILHYESEFQRDWIVQRMKVENPDQQLFMAFVANEWVTVHTAEDTNEVTYTIPTDEVGTFQYRVLAPETDVLSAWASPITTVEVILEQVEVSGWEGGIIEVEEGESPEPFSVTASHNFIVQFVNEDGEWEDLATYEAGTRDIALPEGEGEYRLIVEETSTVEGYTSEVLAVSVVAPTPVPDPDDEDEVEDGDDNENLGGDDNNRSGNNGDNRGVITPTRITGGGSGTGTGNGVTAESGRMTALPTLGSETGMLVGAAGLTMLLGVGTVLLRRRFFGVG